MHHMCDCPKKENLSTLVKESREEEVKAMECCVNPLRFNALRKEESAPLRNGLMYVHIIMNNHLIQL